VGARLGQGKTNIVCGGYVARAVLEGFSVAYYSLEMPHRQIKRRINRAICQRLSKKLLAEYDSFDRDEHNKALDQLAEQVPGRFGIYDPTHGPCDVHAVRDALSEVDLVVVDHVGLMRLGNKLAVSDWRIAAEISNRCTEETLRSNGRLLEVVQVNRQGESASPLHTPRMADIGGTDQLGQDASVGITMSRFSTSVMLHSAEKLRDGASLRWFTRFDPANARYELITRDQAPALAVKDEDQREGHIS
jgi:replicative DNA helicase